MRFFAVRALACLLAATVPAFATDGVIEINQAKALAGGVTPGDTAGFPVTIGLSGSYRLTSDLDLTFLSPGTEENTTAIAVANDNTVITIDLNGFAIRGSTVCGASCLPAGTGQGVTMLSSTQFVTLRNGTIQGMGSSGTGFFAARIENVTCLNNGGPGLFVQNGEVHRAFVVGNGGGINAPGSIVTDSTSKNNLTLGHGIQALRIERSYASSNSLDGIRSTGMVSNSVSANNGGDELFCETLCAVSGNQFKGCSGIACFAGGTILEIPVGSNLCGVEDCF